MALNELMDLFEFLKKQINEHGPYLKADETRTRQVLIDPLLKELGWDVTDPRQVELEYRIDKPFEAKGQKKPDYALMPQGRDNSDDETKPLAVVEAKAWSAVKLDEATTQVDGYAFARGVRYGVATDGDEWRLVDVYKQAPLQQKTETLFTISTDLASTCALKALALWNPNLCLEDGPVIAEEPVLIKINGPPPPPPPPPDNCYPLTELPLDRKFKGMVTLPDGLDVPFGNGARLYTEVTRYLVRSGALQSNQPAFKLFGGSRYAVAPDRYHSDGVEFGNAKDIGNGLWLEVSYSNPKKVELAQLILRKFDVDPATVQVCFD